jgi:hypothetical protein
MGGNVHWFLVRPERCPLASDGFGLYWKFLSWHRLDNRQEMREQGTARTSAWCLKIQA